MRGEILSIPTQRAKSTWIPTTRKDKNPCAQDLIPLLGYSSQAPGPLWSDELAQLKEFHTEPGRACYDLSLAFVTGIFLTLF